MAPLVIRRARGTPKDTRNVHARLRALEVPTGDGLSQALADDRWGMVLLAERRGEPAGVAVLRWMRPLGAPDGPPYRAWLERCDGDDDDVREALREAARAECESLGVTPDEVAPSDAPTAPPEPVDEPPEATSAGDPWALTDDAAITVSAGETAPETTTLWSGALAFRTRWRSDRQGVAWSVDEGFGARDDGGDTLRFELGTRRLREAYLRRPSALLRDPRWLAAAVAAPAREGVVRLATGDGFALPTTDVAAFDTSLAAFVALRGDVVAEASPHAFEAVAISPDVALLFVARRYVGWRVLDPVRHARPMGWPEVRDAVAPSGSSRDELAALLYDWMSIDAGSVVRPDEARDDEDTAHMRGVRDRARALAATDPCAGDAVAEVARDVAAHMHWSWGFFRVSE